MTTGQKNNLTLYDYCPRCLREIGQVNEKEEKEPDLYYCPDCDEYFSEADIDEIFLNKHLGD